MQKSLLIQDDTPKSVTHYAFSDESSYNVGKYQSIGMLSLPINNLESLEDSFLDICSKHAYSDLTKFKWYRLRSADLRNCFLEVIDLVIEYVTNGNLRVDVLVWDTQDSRHNVFGRNDAKNLAIMYYHLFIDVFMNKWPDNAVWEVYPDRNNVIDWKTLVKILNNKGMIISTTEPDEFGLVDINVSNKFKLSIIESTPPESPLIQVADFFAGMAIYSRDNFEKLEEWKNVSSGQTRLFPIDEEITLSRRDRERCLVIHALKNQCTKNKLGVSLKTDKGLKTFNHQKPINFWFYVPQHVEDKAKTI